ncbi:MAG: hypothetical protein NTU57_00395 [Candidatus Aenigmarchaeota archaeon]|nr:hypothetical protein [Candidatus Aenigmarchaeota archaeon]
MKAKLIHCSLAVLLFGVVLISGCTTGSNVGVISPVKATYDCSPDDQECAKTSQVYMTSCTDSIVYSTVGNSEKYVKFKIDLTKSGDTCIVRYVVSDMKNPTPEINFHVGDEMSCHVPMSNWEGHIPLVGDLTPYSKYCYGSLFDIYYEPQKEKNLFCGKAAILIQRASFSDGILSLGLFNTGSVDLKGFFVRLKYSSGKESVVNKDSFEVLSQNINTLDIPSEEDLDGAEIHSTQCSEITNSVGRNDIEGIGYNTK